MRRPLAPVALAFAAGIAFHNLAELPISIFWVATILMMLVCALLLRIEARGRVRTISVLFSIALSGYIYHHSRFHTFPQNHISNFATDDKTIARIRGVVKEPPIQNAKPVNATDEFHPRFFSNTRSTFPVDVERINCCTSSASKWIDVSGRIRVRVYDDMSHLRYGDRVEIVGKLFTLRQPTNAGQFNYKRYLQRAGITAMLTTLRKENIEVLERGKGNIFFRCVYRLKRKLSGTIKGRLSYPASPVLSCLLLGNRHEIPDKLEQAFVKTGTIHFLAISGLHVGISAGILWLLLRLIGVRRRGAAGIVLAFICVYSVLAGMRPSILRAGIIAAALCTGILAKRQWDLLNSTALSAIIILLINPSRLFSAGFQLSYVAVLGIIFFADRTHKLLFGRESLVEILQTPEERNLLWYHLSRYLKAAIAVSLAAWLATMPLTAYYYHIFTPSIILLNIIIFPIVWVLIALGFVFVTVGSVSGAVANLLAYLISPSASALVALVGFSASLPLSHFYLPGPSLFWVAAYYSFAVLFLWRHRLNIRLAVVVVIGVMLANAYVYLDLLRHRPRDMEITCLDVGNGSAIFAEFPNGKTMLYDVGAMGAWNVGEYVVAPFLWHERVNTLDAIVLSHSDSDHCNGSVSIFDRFKVGKLLVNKRFDDSSLGEAILREAREHDIEVSVIADEDGLEGFGDVEVEVLNPPRQDIIVKGLTPNDSSSVLRIAYKGGAILLCGDIEEHGMQLLLQSGHNLRADVIQAPHHGRHTFGNAKFLQAVQPRYVFISADRGSPSHKTMEDYHNVNAQVFQTGEHGAITVELGESITVTSHN